MIVIRIWEGLGNQLFQYAYARALQLRTKQLVYLDVNRPYAMVLEGNRVHRQYTLDKFNIKLRAYEKVDKTFFFLEQKNWVHKFLFFISKKKYTNIHFYEEESVIYKDELKKITGNYYMMGWFQNEKYFIDYRKELLKDLKPCKKIRISKHLKQLLANENTVSIHIRRGDYRMQNNVLPISYYESAVQIIEKKIENPHYIVFSDDVDWVKENFIFLRNKTYISQEHLEDYEELLVMSRCKHNIIANSTFSWWGAWLNTNTNKIVIGPRRWFIGGMNSPINIMPEGWIRI